MPLPRFAPAAGLLLAGFGWAVVGLHAPDHDLTAAAVRQLADDGTAAAAFRAAETHTLPAGLAPVMAPALIFAAGFVAVIAAARRSPTRGVES